MKLSKYTISTLRDKNQIYLLPPYARLNIFNTLHTISIYNYRVILSKLQNIYETNI